MYWRCQQAQGQYCSTVPPRNVIPCSSSIVLWTSIFSISVMLRHYNGVYWCVQSQIKHLKRIRKLRPVLKLRLLTFKIRNIRTGDRFQGWGRVLSTFKLSLCSGKKSGTSLVGWLTCTQHAPPPFWERAAKHKVAGSNPSLGAAFQWEAKHKSTPVLRFTCALKNYGWSKLFSSSPLQLAS